MSVSLSMGNVSVNLGSTSLIVGVLPVWPWIQIRAFIIIHIIKKCGTCCLPSGQQAPPSALNLNRKTSSPHYVSADRAYSSRVESVTISSPQNWRFCCPGNPKIHVSYIMLHTFYRMHDTNIRFLSHKT